MKVLLIAPYINLQYDRSIDHINREDFYPSAALIHLAAILRANNFETRILDFNNSEVHSKTRKTSGNRLETSVQISFVDHSNLGQ